MTHADASVIRRREDGEQHRVVLNLVATLALGQLVRPDDRLYAVARAESLS